MRIIILLLLFVTIAKGQTREATRHQFKLLEKTSNVMKFIEKLPLFNH